MQGTFHIADPDGHMRDASGFHGSLLSLKGFLCLAAMTWSVAAVHPGIVSLGLGCAGLSPPASRGFGDFLSGQLTSTARDQQVRALFASPRVVQTSPESHGWTNQ